MTDYAIETRGLRKEFQTRRGRRVAVQNLDLAVPAGGVHGFLGPNGSGKTTTIRMLLGLAGRERDRYRTYSLGMKQRLAIAATLIKQPDLLILDEPTNGLDPGGIRDIRGTIRDLGRSGVTVLLSSHLLAEVQQVCDSVSIIGEGRLLSAGRVDDLVGREGKHAVRVGVADPAAAIPHLQGAGWRVERDGAALLVVGAPDPGDITRVLGEHGVWVRELVAEGGDLESVFLRLTDGGSAGAQREEGR